MKLIVVVVFVAERAAPSVSRSQSGSRLSQTVSLGSGRLLISAYISGLTGQASEFVQPGRPSEPGSAPAAASQFTS